MNSCNLSSQASIPNTSSGMTILEVLISILIFSIALLGMAAMQSKAMQKNASSSYKTQAMKLVDEMGDILRGQASTGNYSILGIFEELKVDGDNYTQYLRSDNCESSCSSRALIQHYVATWENTIATELPLGQGFVNKVQVKNTIDGEDITVDAYEVIVMWDDRKLSKNYSGSDNLGIQCSGNPNVDLACMKTMILP
ncbi:type IV pilus modification protein PilV [Litoribrevibacter albus]|uniref:Type IV pilus modification protein PilV n=1 Tax=Litoribrevibacter albus TaxID=1473156 RepID=A0AA37W6W4_9GAMM|nr:type IV pilus modification protein PilV [Litoribrevibacter albus]GLQ29906.1 hypothetical protein GCM10007876_03840 [Litoribrevibacter albus]